MAAAAVLCVLFAGTASADAKPFTVGITDPVLESPDAAERGLWLERAVDSRAQLVLELASWQGIAPTAPTAAFDATDPADPQYNWSSLDAAVRDQANRGLEPMLLVSTAPLWAEGKNRPKNTEKALLGTWKPDPGALGEFGEAIASRYSGDFVDPANPGAGALPRVRRFQLWAEPNLSIYLTPQFVGKKPFAPGHYRKMLRSFYEGVHSAVGSDLVVTGGTAPYGDPGRGGLRTQPVRFWRDLLCLKGAGLKPQRCPKPAKFDVWAHNPINVGAPRRNAINPDDASTPDIGRIGRVVRKASSKGTALPRGDKPMYATEIWWDSKPPDPRGVPERKHARWLAESFYLLWKQGAEAVVWFQIRDPDAGGDPASVTQSGLYLRGGKPKLAQRAYRFPFATDVAGKGPVQVWGVAPGRGTVRIERKTGKGWSKVGRSGTDSSRVFTDRVRAGKGDRLRAVSGGESSVPFEVG